MPSNKKKSEQTTPPVETVVSPEPTKKTKSPKPVVDPVAEVKTEAKPRTTKSTKSKAPETVQTDVPVSVCEMENVVVSSDAVEYSITTGFSEFISKFQTMLTSFNAL